MQTFTFIVTDLTEFESEPIKAELESDEEAVMYGSRLAREMLEQMPDMAGRGMCVTVYDGEGEPMSIVPLDPVN